MKKITRILCLVLALALTAGMFVGCGRADDGRAMPEIHPYKVEQVNTHISDYCNYPNGYVITGDRLYVVGYSYDEDNWQESYNIISMRLDGSDVQVSPLEKPDIYQEDDYFYPSGLLAGPNGQLYMLNSTWIWDEATETGHDQYYLFRLNEAGQFVDAVSVNVPEDAYLRTWGATVDANGNIITTSGAGLAVISPAGEYREISIPTDNNYLESAYVRPDGSVMVSYYAGESWTYTIAPVDLVTGRLGDPLPDSDLLSGRSYTIMFGPDGSTYLHNNIGIYSYNEKTGATEILCNWLDSDLDYNAVSNVIIPQADGSFVALGYMEDDWTNLYISTLSYVDPAELPEKAILSVACIYSYQIQSMALRFNRQSETTRIVLTDYSVYNNDSNNYTGGATQLNTDIISGAVPDVLVVDSALPFASYVNKGLFTDLYPLIDADEDYSREDFLPSILKACETDGALTSFIPTFGINTVVARTDRVGDRMGWTVEEFFNILNADANIQQAFPRMTRQEMLYLTVLFNIGQFIDPVAGTCDFDNDAFIQLLEYAASYPEEIDWDNWEDERNIFNEGRALLYTAYLNDFGSVRDYVYTMGGDVSYIGFPTQDGSAGSLLQPDLQLAISEACPDKEAAWEFVSWFVGDEYLDRNSWNFPNRLDRLQDKIDSAMNPDEDRWFAGSVAVDVVGGAVSSAVTVDGVYYDTDDDVDADDIDNDAEPIDDGDMDGDMAVPDIEDPWGGEQNYWNRPVTQTEIDRIMALIENTTTLYSYDSALMDIINEEVESFFKGTKTAAEVAYIIQDRASTYLGESR